MISTEEHKNIKSGETRFDKIYSVRKGLDSLYRKYLEGESSLRRMN